MSSNSNILNFAQLIDNNYAAWNTLDADQAAVFYASIPNLVIFDLGHRCDGWDAYRNLAQQALDTMANFQLQRTSEPIIIVGATIVVSTNNFKVQSLSKNNQISNYTGYHTIVWQQIAGSWLIVHEHQSPAAT